MSIALDPVQVPLGTFELEASLHIPSNASGIVIFAHGSGSSRHSLRNRFVAQFLNAGGLGTLLIDLLTPAEEAIDRETAHLRFDIGLLAGRLVRVTDWLPHQPECHNLPLGYFGSSTGAAAALMAAAERPQAIQAVVSRGGRPDLAGIVLPYVQAPTLLIVGGEDTHVILLNRRVMPLLRSEVNLEIIPGATHLFEEPGALEEVARFALGWFQQHFHSPASAPAHAAQQR